MKYIVFEKPGNLPLVVAFTSPMTHAAMAAVLKTDGWKPTSAGFLDSVGAPFGESASLKLGVLPFDAELIARMARLTRETSSAPLPEAPKYHALGAPFDEPLPAQSRP